MDALAAEFNVNLELAVLQEFFGDDSARNWHSAEPP
jgi:hypothetical protein